MDKYTSSLLKRLGSHSGVVNVSFEQQEPCTTAAISVWETKHGYTLPEDFKAFLQASDGMTLTWDIEFRETIHTDFACMHINCLKDVVSVPLDTFPADERHHCLDLYDGHAETSHKGEPVRAFDIDNRCKSGRVCLLFFENQTEPQVWFQDLGCTWNFVAGTFTEYFRVLVLYLGLAHWQYAFTKHGLDPVVRKWVNFLCPGRLASTATDQQDEDTDSPILHEGTKILPSGSTMAGNGKGAGLITATATAAAAAAAKPSKEFSSQASSQGSTRPGPGRRNILLSGTAASAHAASRPISASPGTHLQQPPSGSVISSSQRMGRNGNL